MARTLFSFGYGYSAQALGRHLLPDGWRIVGTTRDAGRTQAIREKGAHPLLFPGTDLSVLRDALADASHLLISAGPTRDGDPVLSILREEIAVVAPSLQWVGYLSTTGVYGDHQGKWIDETAPLNPTTQRGQWRKDAEAAWAAIPNLPLHVFRLAGIYGPGRGPFAKLRNGTARRIIKEGQVFSRIHVEDIAQVLAASIVRPNPGAIYNLCDDDPAPPQDVIAYAAELLGLPVPPAVAIDDVEMTPMARSFYSENKRVRNDRIKDELGIKLIYPDFRSGLSAMVKKDR